MKTEVKSRDNGAIAGYEAELWRMADTLRGSMDAAEYKHVVLGLLFLKYISDAFEEMRVRLEGERAQGADPEDPDEYRAENIFWVPVKARWTHLKAQAKQPIIGERIDDAMTGIEHDNPSLRDVLPKDYARPALDKQRLGQLIDMISNIRVGDEEARSKDVLGRVYEYFLSQFASAEGKKGGEFYTPRCVVKLLVEMLEPWQGRVYDPCCGSSGMFVQSVEFIRAHATGNGNSGRARNDISIYGQESNYTTWRLAKMNLAIRGIEGQIAHGDTFHNDRHPDLKADFILANPPFNISDWGGRQLTDDKRWQYGIPPKGNANFAWVQHIVHHLAPNGTAGFVLANGSMSSNQSGEGNIRKSLLEADLVECMVALPGQLFYSTQIPACLWFLARDHHTSCGRVGLSSGRDRRGEVLFIDARKLGRMVDRTHRELTHEDVARIADTYHAWRHRTPSLSPSPSKAEGRGEGAATKHSPLSPSPSKAEGRGEGATTELSPSPSKGEGRGEGATTELSPSPSKGEGRGEGATTELSPSPSKGEGRGEGATTELSPSPSKGEGRGEGDSLYRDIPGFCKSATLDEIRKHGHILTPGRYVGAERQEDDGEPFEVKMGRLTAQWREQQEEATRLDTAIAANLKLLGFGENR